ncbi:glycosyltransferase [Oceanirhabdus sp. W0125-5]|uniref:glycosyltransferase n=1 Tax=Oceanirhabdus sp. W0125-5 TaxID=2999116 RepID=UPI0022F329D1|nr:glycosyltransferase [Oceanirhabdus sp. W0125-5]WBW98952.1 glycosyltransferase [Oceanirhabdus sp. W0125-5]
MKKKILISSFDMEVGGVERSLISLLENFDYDKYDVDLMLYRHQGDFMTMLPNGHNLLKEIPEYSTFRKSIFEIIKNGHYRIAFSRIIAKYVGRVISSCKRFEELGLVSMQLGWKYALPALPSLKKEYDVAISYLWPHYFVKEKVNARKKIAWIHTDYSKLEIDNKIDSKMWEDFDLIVGVSESCVSSFLKKYPQFKERTLVIENISSTSFIKKMAEESCGELIDKDNCINLITVARLSLAKGIDDAVKACRKLINQGYNIKWYVVGYGSEEKNLKELINNLNLKDKFILLGKKINPYPYVKACDIYVQPSRYEGKAVTVTEAQILGKPVVITNYNTAKSQVKDGFDGIITEMGVDGIVNGVKELINNKELLESLKYNTSNFNFANNYELEKLYGVIENRYIS